ncbi:uncharacterized protein LACBIDRAFT_314317 [Laccaria bicolor S238N-H82]|uniref:Predicted protein n=1 Tax=Laccaria bicolor (strain S238N-H82 / ATCC MYA-4686) TaxID=486041 RepID=B0DYA1_LACBS|nr:uncharacterized protein LACBIDRAFT_314317 [Laccaria bicolor S238N-H82]EDR00400.1 predicted protein [Laccaria bicolor S238N-H82]|eukprot:XP_001888959.1 predicted protein [Laccaria bicolor S238N-H82]
MCRKRSTYGHVSSTRMINDCVDMQENDEESSPEFCGLYPRRTHDGPFEKFKLQNRGRQR